MPGQPQQPGGRPDQNQDCEPIILFYHQGRLYQLQPGPGQRPGPGRPSSPPEFFPLRPYQGPSIPGLPGVPGVPNVPGAPWQTPGPQEPGFRPQTPRF
ncbi:MAG: hypothetical protein HY660_04025 [Armatimonadetes bacterium]|nr:hypothetical protein [Armatimonadota bacterium]